MATIWKADIRKDCDISVSAEAEGGSLTFNVTMECLAEKKLKQMGEVPMCPDEFNKYLTEKYSGSDVENQKLILHLKAQKGCIVEYLHHMKGKYRNGHFSILQNLIWLKHFELLRLCLREVDDIPKLMMHKYEHGNNILCMMCIMGYNDGTKMLDIEALEMFHVFSGRKLYTMCLIEKNMTGFCFLDLFKIRKSSISKSGEIINHLDSFIKRGFKFPSK